MNYQAPTYALIGNGRVARHLHYYFQLLGLPIAQWYRPQSTVALEQIIGDATHVIVAISDRSIEPFLQTLHTEQSKVFIHCCGTLVTNLAYGAHPLQTFSASELYTLETYQKIPFIVEQSGPSFTELLPGLPNPSFSIAPEKKAFYHALCVMANNFTTQLWQKIFHEFEHTLHIDQQALLPLLNQTCTNLKTNYRAALTGPIARRDTLTLQCHLNALQEDPFYDVYQAFINAAKIHEHT